MSISGGGTNRPTNIPQPGQAPSAAQAAIDADLSAAGVQNELAALLNRAGFERDASGNLVVRDASPVAMPGTPGPALAAAAAAGATAQVAPPSPVQIELTDDLSQGALSFADNMNRVLNEFLTAARRGGAGFGKRPQRAGKRGGGSGQRCRSIRRHHHDPRWSDPPRPGADRKSGHTAQNSRRHVTGPAAGALLKAQHRRPEQHRRYSQQIAAISERSAPTSHRRVPTKSKDSCRAKEGGPKVRGPSPDASARSCRW